MAEANIADLEINSSLPASKVYKAYCFDFDDIAPKVLPDTFKSIETVEGDGGVGSIKFTKFGDAGPPGSSKHKVDAVDKDNLTYSFTVYEGGLLIDTYESITYHIKVVPTSDGGSIFKQRAIYKCKPGLELKEEHLSQGKHQFTGVFKAIEGHVLAHPDAY